MIIFLFYSSCNIVISKFKPEEFFSFFFLIILARIKKYYMYHKIMCFQLLLHKMTIVRWLLTVSRYH